MVYLIGYSSIRQRSKCLEKHLNIAISWVTRLLELKVVSLARDLKQWSAGLNIESLTDWRKQTVLPFFGDYCGEREERIINSTAPISSISRYRCDGQVPETVMTGFPTDISAISEFEWWELIKYKLEGEKYPFSSRFIGRCLGPSDFGSEMCYNVLSQKGKVLPVSTLRSLTPAERSDPTLSERIQSFDNFIRERFGDPYTSINDIVKSDILDR